MQLFSADAKIFSKNFKTFSPVKKKELIIIHYRIIGLFSSADLKGPFSAEKIEN